MAFFSCSVLIWLWYQGNVGLVKCVWEFFLLFSFFQKSLIRIDISYPLNVWYNSPVKSSCPGISVLGGFWLLESLYSLLVSSDFLFLHGSALVGCMFLKICAFPLGYPQGRFFKKKDVRAYLYQSVMAKDRRRIWRCRKEEVRRNRTLWRHRDMSTLLTEEKAVYKYRWRKIVDLVLERWRRLHHPVTELGLF